VQNLVDKPIITIPLRFASLHVSQTCHMFFPDRIRLANNKARLFNYRSCGMRATFITIYFSLLVPQNGESLSTGIIMILTKGKDALQSVIITHLLPNLCL
jgi:hypothetical protein